MPSVLWELRPLHPSLMAFPKVEQERRINLGLPVFCVSPWKVTMEIHNGESQWKFPESPEAEKPVLLCATCCLPLSI